MKDLFEEALKKARAYVGMAAVCLTWDGRDWIAIASWSGEPPTQIVTEGHSEPENALYELSILLDAKRENERPITSQSKGICHAE